MKLSAFIILLSSSLLPNVSFGTDVARPNPNLTIGTFCTTSDPDFKELRYAEQVPVCFRNVTTEQKDKIMVRYGYDPKDRYEYEIDHCIPLSLGGSNHFDNLWPQPRDEYNSIAKNKLVKHLYDQLMAGTIAYKDALAQIRVWCPSPEQ